MKTIIAFALILIITPYLCKWKHENMDNAARIANMIDYENRTYVDDDEFKEKKCHWVSNGFGGIIWYTCKN